MSESIEDRLKAMMVDRLFMKIPPEEIASDKSLVTEYGVDSLLLLELIVGVEEEFGLEIEDTEFQVQNFETVDALAAFVRGKLAG
jgi:acyl carrier protein